MSQTNEINGELTLEHASVRRIGDREDVWWNFMSLLAFVQLDHFLGVNG